MYPSVRTHLIDHKDEGRRLDNYLAALTKGVPRSHLYKIIRSGEVRINGKRISANIRLKANDQLRIPPLFERELRRPSLGWEPHILHRDEDFMVINKPAGMAVHAGSKQRFGLIDHLRALLADDDWRLIHRLDLDTTGCLLVARTAQCAKRWQQKETMPNILSKYYLVMVAGLMKKPSFIVDLAIETDKSRNPRIKSRISDQGRAARTRFFVIDAKPSYSLAKAELLSGRTHQIRVHLAHLGHPVVGDRRYASFEKSSPVVDRSALMLHAFSISLQLDAKKTINIEAPIPHHFYTFAQKQGLVLPPQSSPSC